jgi:C2 domain-containing protein 3
MNKNNLICELQFNKEHLFLCSAPFLWYLREEKLEIQIWTSENDTYDYSQSLASTTDKLIGSIYIDLNLLCDKRRKSHRISAILPMFKQGTKDLNDACVQIHITLDKSKDVNELKVYFISYEYFNHLFF